MARTVPPAVPAGLVELGTVRGAYGVQGWVRIAPHAIDGDVLGAVPEWWLIAGSQARPINVTGRRRHRAEWLAKWSGCESKEAADALKGATVAVERSRFPELDAGVHYLTDLIGSRVVNRSGEALGTVSGLRANDAGGVVRQWLEVKGGEKDAEAARLIPLVEPYVDEVDAEQRLIRVDWQRDW